MEQAKQISAEYGMQHAQEVVRLRIASARAAAHGSIFRALELKREAETAEERVRHCARFILAIH
jgi:hypothetical protein